MSDVTWTSVIWPEDDKFENKNVEWVYQISVAAPRLC